MMKAKQYIYARLITVLLSTTCMAKMPLTEEREGLIGTSPVKRLLGNEVITGDSEAFSKYKKVLLETENEQKSPPHSVVKNAKEDNNTDARYFKAARLQSMVMEDEEGQVKLNPIMTAHQDTIILMNDLSYAVAKRQGFSDEMNKCIAYLNATSKDLEELAQITDVFCGFSVMDLAAMELEERKNLLRRQIAVYEEKIEMHGSKIRTYRESLLAQGWELRVIEGRTGYKTISGDDRRFVEDDRGFVAYHSATNTMTVVYHGSRNDNDWHTNFDGQRVAASEVGLDLPEFVQLHRGFGHAVASTHSFAREAILDIVNKLNDTKRQELKIIYSGHSQGAAVSQAAAVAAAATIGREIFGKDFDNTKTNNFMYYGLSAPRVFAGQQTKEWVEQIFGRDNIIRQNVHGDPVPVAALKELDTFQAAVIKAIQDPDYKSIAAKWMLEKTGISRVPFIGKWIAPKIENVAEWGLEKLIAVMREYPQFQLLFEENLEQAVEKYIGYESVGHLALDDVREAHKRNVWPQTRALLSRFVSNTSDVVKGYWGRLWGKESAKAAPGVGSLVKNTFMDAVTTFVSPFHYGSTVEDNGGAFDHRVVGRNLSELLKIGKAHQAQKQAIISK